MANGRLNLTDEQTRPLFTPAPYGLLDTATELPDLPPHWQQGLNWEPLCAEGVTTYSRCLVVTRGDSDEVTEPTGEVPDPPDKSESTLHTTRGSTPFAAVVEIDCAPTAGPEVVRRRAAEALTRAEQRIVENTFWTGVAAGAEVVYPHLAASDPLVETDATGAVLQPEVELVSSDPVNRVAALGQLERDIGQCYDGVATIHMPRQLVAQYAAEDLLLARAGQLFTLAGNKVVAGRGYPDTGPGGVDTTGATWMFATSEVFYQRGQIWQPNTIESLDRERNTVRAMAERTYVLGWDCCLLAVPVSIQEGL